ncbi:MAG: aminopeptidase P family protein [Oscillospiraceae bacterium]|nr:aminopeptidase P family protein [Oscillospiraceae bacterium]
MQCENLRQLQTKIPTRCAALIRGATNRRYLLCFASSGGMLFVTRQAAVFLTDSRYIEAARAQVLTCPVEELKNGREQLRALCKQHHIKTLLPEPETTTLAQAAELRRWLPPTVRLAAKNDLIDRTLRAQRMHKSPPEVAAITRAQRIAEAALAQVLPQIRVGATERGIALALDIAMLQGGAEALAFETIVAAGPNGSRPHAVPGDYALRSGDFVTMDFGAVVDGCHSDMTRTVAVGAPTAEQRAIYQTVLAAQRAALEALKPGVACKAADAAAREVIAAAGYGDCFRHGTGHGVGFNIHEAPSLSSKSDETLRPGMVVTVEPGIYLPGKCGVRIEDMAVITADGHKNLTMASKELIL